MSPKRRVAANRRSRVARAELTGPSQLKTNVELKHQYRFVSSSATLTSITDSLLLTAAGVMASTAVLGHSLYRTVKLNRIEIWTPPASQGAAATCSVFFPAGNNNPSREFSDTTVSVSVPAHVNTVPPPRSISSFWQSNTGALLCQLVAPPGSLIDVWVSLILHDGTTGATATLVGATAGIVYYCSLDSATAAGSLYTPVSLTRL